MSKETVSNSRNYISGGELMNMDIDIFFLSPSTLQIKIN